MSEKQTNLEAGSSELEFWRAAVGEERIRSVSILHESIVGDLTESLAHAVKLRFSGFIVEQPLKFLKRLPDSTYVIVFCGGELLYAGAVLFSLEFAQEIIANWFNLRNLSQSGGLTWLEESSFWRAAERLTQVLLSAYANAGLSQPTMVSSGRLRDRIDALASSREIVAFKYVAESSGVERTGLPVCVLLDTEMVLRLVTPKKEDPSFDSVPLYPPVTHRLPIETRVVLGSFRMPLAKLSAVKLGETILLPDPDEAWLGTADNLKLFPLEVELDGQRARLRVRGSDEPAN